MFVLGSPVPFSKFYDTILHIIMSKINDAAQEN